MNRFHATNKLLLKYPKKGKGTIGKGKVRAGKVIKSARGKGIKLSQAVTN